MFQAENIFHDSATLNPKLKGTYLLAKIRCFHYTHCFSPLRYRGTHVGEIAQNTVSHHNPKK